MAVRPSTVFAGRADNRFSHRNDLARQAAIAGELGSPFVQHVLEAAWRQLDHAPRLAETIDFWAGDFAADAVAMRLNAGLHALARRGSHPALSRLYRERVGDFDAIIAAVLALEEDELLQWLHWPTQTNEVARSSAFMAALLTMAARDPRPVELLEIGTSAGLNLNLTRYRHILGGRAFGDPHSRLTLEPEWVGSPPPSATVEVTRAQGVDLRPIVIADPLAQERMMAFVWADREDRRARLAAAIAVARGSPPVVHRGSAPEWLVEQTARPQPDGVRRVVVHSMVAQYLTDAERRSLFDAILRAGRRSTPDRPFAWISLEWTADRREVQLRLAEWPTADGDGIITTLATCHPYGNRIDWRGDQAGC